MGPDNAACRCGCLQLRYGDRGTLIRRNIRCRPHDQQVVLAREFVLIGKLCLLCRGKRFIGQQLLAGLGNKPALEDRAKIVTVLIPEIIQLGSHDRLEIRFPAFVHHF